MVATNRTKKAKKKQVAAALRRGAQLAVDPSFVPPISTRFQAANAAAVLLHALSRPGSNGCGGGELAQYANLTASKGASAADQACRASTHSVSLYSGSYLAWVYAALGSTRKGSTSGGSKRSGKRSSGDDGSDEAGRAKKPKGG